MTGVRVLAPAKLNLGLELLGKRPDGYHEIRTVMAMVGHFDEIRITPSGVDELSMIPHLGNEQNLVAVARARFAAAASTLQPVWIEVTKRIPFAGGLGGASADAAATLLALNAMQPSDAKLTATALHALAASLGSDVPFFLHGPIALASGTGTEITPLTPLVTAMHAVLVAPPIKLPRKTATLYATIQPGDFTDGSRTAAVAEAISSQTGGQLATELLANPFRTAWKRLGDPLAQYEAAMLKADAPWVALSGAGPTLYTLIPDENAAQAVANRLRQDLPAGVGVHIAPLLRAGIVVNVEGAP